MAKKLKPQGPALGIQIGRRTEVLFARVKPETKEWLAQEAKKAGADGLGDYMDHLVERLRGL